MGQSLRAQATLAAGLLLAGCTDSVPLTPVDKTAIRTDTERLSLLDQGHLTPVLFSPREAIHPAEAYVLLQHLAVAAQPFCQALNGDCHFRLKIRRSNALEVTLSKEGQLGLPARLVRVLHYEDELAFILAQAMGHRIAGHGDSRTLRERAGAVAGFLVGAGLMTASALSGLSMDQTTSQEMGRATDNLAAIGERTGGLTFSQHEELEADKLGLLIMNAAGYQPTAALRALELLAIEAEGTEDESSFWGARPGFGERIARLRAEIDQLPPSPAKGEVAAQRVVQMPLKPRMMVWGDDISPLE